MAGDGLGGVRYPSEALTRQERDGVDYGGWIPNFGVPAVLARFRATVHIPRTKGGQHRRDDYRTVTLPRRS